MFFNIVKAINKETKVNIIINGKKFTIVSISFHWDEIHTVKLPITFTIIHCIRIPSNSNQAREGNKRKSN